MTGANATGKSTRKILLLASYAPSLVNFRGPLIEDLQKAGHTIAVAAPDIDENLKAQLQALGAEVHEAPFKRTGLNPFHDLILLFELVKLYKNIKPEYILSYTAKPNIWGAIAAGIARIPSSMMVTGLGLPFTNTKGFKLHAIRFVTSKLYRIATTFSHRVVFQNPDDRDDFIQAGALGKVEKACLVNGSGVDTSHYDQTPLPKTAIFFMASRLLVNKGVHEFGDAAARLLNDGVDASFVLAGYMDGGHDSIQQTELDKWVAAGLDYVGPMDDVRQGISNASVYVLPSYREGTPRSVLEAMSMGRAIITSDAPGCRETTKDGENGFLVPVQNVDVLCKRMRELVESPKKRETMGAASRQIAIEKYDVRKVNAKLMQHLEL